MSEQLELPLPKREIVVDGYVDEKNNVRYIGKAQQQFDGKFDGKWQALAIVGNALYVVECKIREVPPDAR